MASLPAYLDTDSNGSGHQSSFKDDYIIIEELGRGGFGVVYRAQYRIDEKEYAVKRIKIPFSFSEEEQEKVLREVKVLAELDNHPNIVRYYHGWLEKNKYRSKSSRKTESSRGKSLVNKPAIMDVVEESNSIEFLHSLQDMERKRKRSSSDTNSESPSPKQYLLEKLGCFLYIKMELMKTDLKTWMINTQKRRRDVIRDMIRDILSAVAYMHGEGYMHRDLTRSNIFLTEENVIKVGDFGLAKSINPENILNKENEIHTSGIGVEVYMSPEYLESRPYSYPVDVYAAGVIWVELLIYFSTESERYEVLRNLKMGIFPIDFCTMFPMEYEIISSMLAENPDARPAADVVCDRLENMSINDRLMSQQTDSVLQDMLHKI